MPAAPASEWWWSGRIMSASLRDKRLTVSGSFIAATTAARFARAPARPRDCIPPRVANSGCNYRHCERSEAIHLFRRRTMGPVADLVGIRVGVVSGVMNLESSGVEASDWRPRHEQVYHDA